MSRRQQRGVNVFLYIEDMVEYLKFPYVRVCTTHQKRVIKNKHSKI